MPSTFHHPRLRGPRRQALLDAAVRNFPEQFKVKDDAAAYLTAICAPHSRRWVFCSNGKSGTSSAKRFLFELEFGARLNARFLSTTDINPDAVSHQLIASDVFRPLSFMPDGLDVFAQALRLATVRHPESRAVSAFLYLCKSNELGFQWFVRDRLHMNALVQFDWENDMRTPRGFEKFLRYIEICVENRGPQSVDPHWRPQHATIRPEIFLPGLIGKTEALPEFFKKIAEQLDQPLPGSWEAPAANKNPDQTARAKLMSPAARKLIEKIYVQDFEQFGYQPGWA
ncbi:sulfotransferase family 2 domain-containing protein [Leisingera sp. McT4-56]|uniref:sulfotransferase family 2 domain-containing protein n=1 Tax=Leisingera sp. McT4-56 TaxID=2881255 RepID=UPI001CF815D6|nr:sulfotransferase family 2 domain-containing protein [Leisingera sp. McT4-56]MCB4454687.1 sulfotransferase family protein [Leisingera sp. McT4-56]